MRKYGIEHFTISEICSCENSELNQKEMHYIQLFNSFVPNGYNLTLGGDGHTQYNYEDVVKCYFDCNENITSTMKYLNCSYDTVKNALNSQQIKNHDCNWHSQVEVYECDYKGNIIEKFPNYQAVEDKYKDIGITRESLSNFFAQQKRGRKLYAHKGKILVRKDRYEEMKDKTLSSASKKQVICLDTGEIFESIRAAAEWVKLNNPDIQGSISTVVSNISHAIANNWKSYGYKWLKL